MSINSMANAAAARRPDMVPLGEIPKTLDQIAKAAGTTPSVTPAPVEPGKPASAAGTTDTTFNVLFGYIPTEVITLYVAVLAAVEQGGNMTNTGWVVFWIFLGATPIIVWLVYGAKLKALQKPIPIRFGSWPLWEMFAATIAYTAWTFALPHSPFTEFTWYSSAISGMAVLVVSTFLGLLTPFFQKPLGT